jgi:hypothetical protein
MPFHNPALLLLWKVAAIEASHLDSEYIEPIHFILAALKTVDIDIKEVYDSTFMPPAEVKNIDNELSELRNIFVNAGINAKECRRRLRKNIKGEYLIRYTKGSNIIHRSPNCKRIFNLVETKLDLKHDSLSPILLIEAILRELSSTEILFLEKSGANTIKLKSFLERKDTSFEGATKNDLFLKQSNVTMAIGYFELSMFDEAETYIKQCNEEELKNPKIIAIINHINKIRGV